MSQGSITTPPELHTPEARALLRWLIAELQRANDEISALDNRIKALESAP